jgi:hypothetical protein
VVASRRADTDAGEDHKEQEMSNKQQKQQIKEPSARAVNDEQ